MIFDTIYNFFVQILSHDDISYFMSNGWISIPGGEMTTIVDYLSCMGTFIVIGFGIVALFRILGGILRLFKV